MATALCAFRKDDNWNLSRGVYIFVTLGLLLLLGAISAVTLVIKPWTVRETCSILLFLSFWHGYLSKRCLMTLEQIGVAFLLVLLMIVLAISAIHLWASNNFYLTRTQTFFVCFLAFLLALAAFVVGWFGGKNKFYHLSLCAGSVSILHNYNSPVATKVSNGTVIFQINHLWGHRLVIFLSCFFLLGEH